MMDYVAEAVLILFSILAFITCILWFIRNVIWSYCLQRFGKVVDGSFVRSRTSIITRGRSYFITYQFTYENESHLPQVKQREQEVGYELYKQLNAKSRLQIIYDPQRVHISRLAGTYRDGTSTFRAVYYAILIVCFWLLVNAIS